MTTIQAQLQQARQAIIEFNPDLANVILNKIETTLPHAQLSVSEAETYMSKLQEISGLAQAAKDGVSAARQRLIEAANTAKNFDTYDRSGKKREKRITTRSNKKF